MPMADGRRKYPIRGKEAIQTRIVSFDDDVTDQLVAMLSNPSFGTIFLSGFKMGSSEYEGIYTKGSVSWIESYGSQNFIDLSLTRLSNLWAMSVLFDQKFETAWDVIQTDFACSADNDIGEGTTSLLPTTDYDVATYWFADVGDWYHEATVAGTDYIYCDATNGYNSIFLRKALNDHDYICSDIQVEVSCNVYDYGGGGDNEAAGITIRAQHDPTNTTYGYGYFWCLEPEDAVADAGQLSFYRHEGAASTTLFQVDGYTFVFAQANYDLKIIAQGDRFDLYFAEEYITTVYDDTYSAGMIGLKSSHEQAQFDNFRAEIMKPMLVPLPVGSQQINQHVTHSVYGNEGKIQNVIWPEKEVTFDQRAARIGSDALVLDLPLNEGYGTPVDQSGYGQTIVTATGTWIEGVNRWTQKGMHCLETPNNFIRISDSDSLDIGIGSTYHHIIFKQHATAGGDSYFYHKGGTLIHIVQQTNNDSWRVVPYINGAVVIDTDYPLLLDTEYHLIFTYDGTTVNCYVNGALVKTQAVTGRLDVTASNIEIPDAAVAIRGTIELFGFGQWNRALTAEEVAFLSRGYGDLSGGELKCWDTAGYELSDEALVGRWHMDEGRWRADGTTGYLYDSSGNGHDSIGGTLPDWVIDDSFRSEARHCLDFESGSNFTVDLGDHADFSFINDAPFSVVCWFKPESVNIWQHLVSKYKTTDDTREWSLYITNTGLVRLGLFNPDGTIYLIQECGTALVAGRWYYIVATYSGSGTVAGIKIHINTVDDSTTTYTAGVWVGMTNTTSGLRIGSIDNPANPADGYMDDVELWGRELPPAEIATRYQLGPILHDRANWVRQYGLGSTKGYVGNLVVENGLTRLVVEPSDGNETQIKRYVFTDGYWKEMGLIYFHLDTLSFDSYRYDTTPGFRLLADIRLVEVSRDQIIIEVITEMQDSDEADKNPVVYRLILRSGFAGVIYESVYPKTWDTLGFGQLTGVVDLSPQMLRFAWVPGNDPIDAILDATTNHTSSDDNYLITFDPNKDVVETIFLNQALEGTVGMRVGIDGTGDRLNFMKTVGMDGLAPYYRGGVAFHSMDVTNLYSLATQAAWAGEAGGQAKWADLGTTIYLDAGTPGPATVQITGFEKGQYIAWFFLGSANGDEDCTITTTGDMAPQTRAILNVTNAAGGQYEALVFHADDDDDITFGVERDAGTGNLNVGYVLIFPISNAHGWSLDNSHQAQRQTLFRRIGA